MPTPKPKQWKCPTCGEENPSPPVARLACKGCGAARPHLSTPDKPYEHKVDPPVPKNEEP